MANCKFSSLTFGQVVKLGGGTSCCGICGYNIQPVIETMQWSYQGHSDDLDLFQAVTNNFCPSCGKRIDGYAERCGEFGGLQIGIFETIEKVKNENI